jgi:hypothetical protein
MCNFSSHRCTASSLFQRKASSSALPIGMQGLLFRLDEQMKSRALATGAKLYPECG